MPAPTSKTPMAQASPRPSTRPNAGVGIDMPNDLDTPPMEFEDIGDNTTDAPLPPKAATHSTTKPISTQSSQAQPDAAAAQQADAATNALLALHSMFSAESERLALHVALCGTRPLEAENLITCLAPSDFFVEHHVGLWQCITALHERNKPFDVASVLDYARAHNILVGDVVYLTDLLDDVLFSAADSKSITEASDRIKNFVQLRQLQEIFQQGLQLCAQAPEHASIVSTTVQDALINLERQSTSANQGPKHIREITEMVIDKIERVMDGEPLSVVPSRFDSLDRLITGFADGDLIILAARPSMGKTAFMNALAENVTRLQSNEADRAHIAQTLIFSTEMTSESLGFRQLSSFSGVHNEKLKRGEMDDYEITSMMRGMESLIKHDIWIDDTPGLTLSEIRARTRKFVREHGRCVVMVDYLQNISALEGKETKDHVSECSRGLKQLARELKLPVIALSQLNRSVEQRANKRPLMSDLRESGAIEQDADLIMFLYRDEYYNPDTDRPGVTEVLVAKQRDGATGAAALHFDKRTGRFTDMTSGQDYGY